MSYYKADTVRSSASGKWLLIVSQLAPHADEALKNPGRHVGCPIHGGKDGFRLFRKDFLETGGGICNTCGPRHDGFELLMWLNNWSFKETLEAVGGLLGVEKEGARRARRAEHQQATQKVTSCGYSATATADAAGDAEVENNVIPMRLMEKTEAWMEEVQLKMEQQAAQARQAGARASENVSRIWKECLPLSSESAGPMREYLKSRGLTYGWDEIHQSNSLRFHPSLGYFDEDGQKVGDYPAIICAIRDKEGNLITLHRIYLSPTGSKARVKMVKKMMPVPSGLEVTGGAIRLGSPVNGVLGLAEGVETAMSAFRATHIPVWATVSATLMELVELPEDVHTVLIWADKDKSLTGERSASVLKTRLEEKGIRVIILMPQLSIPNRQKSVDWNDVLMSQGIFGFPDGRHIRKVALGGNGHVSA